MHMTTARLTLGRTTFEVSVPAEFDLDPIFCAANRIGDIDTDLAALPREWLKSIRLAIDINGAPSMSVGDTIEHLGPDRTVLVRHTCEPVGWKSERVAA